MTINKGIICCNYGYFSRYMALLRDGAKGMVKNRRITAIGVLSLLATVMTALALLVSPPICDKQVKTVKDAETFGKTDVSVNGAITDDAFPAAISIEGSNIVTESKEYLLKEVSGYVGIFSPEDTETPQSITQIALSKLREADARMFREGIIVKGEEELAKLLEDFGS
jgi:hypothetical protein